VQGLSRLLLEKRVPERPRPQRAGRSGAIAIAAAALAICLAVAGSTGCGGKDQPGSAASAADFTKALKGAPAPLGKLYSSSGGLEEGGEPAFKRQLGQLRGYPVVVNKWAAWCGPCRFEFPFFQRLVQKRGKQVAFLGVDSRDVRDDAEKFLRRFPVPYPSFFDPDGEVARAFRGDRVSPTTAFYDRSGQLVYTKQGGYDSERAIADDVERYAVGGARKK
jgi:thiol-disulfide isomerase/thioredoxin